MNALTVERLRECLHYNEAEGVFTWKVKAARNTVIGSVAGCFSPGSPVRIRIDGKCYRAHRLAWLYVHGAWPTGVIDHKNGSNRANGIANLRDTSNKVNSQNMRKAHADSRTGLLGVVRRNGGYVAQIYVNGRGLYLGKYETPELASAAYVTAKRVLHEGNTL